MININEAKKKQKKQERKGSTNVKVNTEIKTK